jgi:hypothetical protein
MLYKLLLEPRQLVDVALAIWFNERIEANDRSVEEVRQTQGRESFDSASTIGWLLRVSV